MKPELQFDPKAHRYTLGDRRLISNTDLLTAEGFSDYSGMPEDRRRIALAIGTDVHEATARLDRKWDWQKDYSHVVGYVMAWKQFKKDFKFKPSIIEEPMYDPTYLIGTTPDRWGHSREHGDITVQIKTGVVKDWVGLQLAFEERCIYLTKKTGLHMQSTPYRFAVELRANGTYQPRRFTEERDISTFLAASQVYMWRLNHNCL